MATPTTLAQQFSFGSGYLYGLPVSGSTSIQPQLLGTLQEVTYDISSSVKELYGQYQFAAAVGRGPAKFTGKAKFGQFNSVAWNNFFFGTGTDGSAAPSVGTGSIVTVNREVGSATTQAVTFANTANGTFTDDLGLYYAVTGNALIKVTTGSPATGQYKVSAVGVYTVASADTAANAASGLVLAYTYQPTSATRVVQSINNTAFPMGAAPVFQIIHDIPYTSGSTNVGFKIYSAMSNKLAMTFKNEDFTVPEIDFTLFANSAGKVMDIITTY